MSYVSLWSEEKFETGSEEPVKVAALQLTKSGLCSRDRPLVEGAGGTGTGSEWKVRRTKFTLSQRLVLK